MTHLCVAVERGALHRNDCDISKRTMQNQRKEGFQKEGRFGGFVFWENDNNPRTRVGIVPAGTEAMRLDELRKKSSANDETTVFIRNALECKLRVRRCREELIFRRGMPRRTM